MTVRSGNRHRGVDCNIIEINIVGNITESEVLMMKERAMGANE